MIPILPDYVWIIFLLTVILTGYLFFLASNKSRAFLRISLLWVLLQTSASLKLFYLVTSGTPPRFILLLLPPLIFILTLFVTKWGKKWLDNLDLQMLTATHMVRIPVELVLYWLFLSGWVPELMTFAGRNFDILAGITAPIMVMLVFVRKKIGLKALLTWNIIALGLVLFIVVNAILSTQSIFQQFAFNQPNRAISYFPFTLLAAYVVPIVLLSHLAAIRLISQKLKSS